MSKVLWRANTGRHDWRDGGPLRRIVDSAERLGLIDSSQRVYDELAAAPAPTAGRALAEAKVVGDNPAPWEIYWNVYPFDTEEGWVDGLNTFWFTFDRSRVPGRRESDALRESFFAAHTPADTEYAMIHPYDQWSDFSDSHYHIPVTINLSFRGVCWANFLGPGHIEEFDREKLRDLEAHEVRWLGEKGLFVIATPDLASADAPDSEPTLLALTKRFRDALSPQSRWRPRKR